MLLNYLKLSLRLLVRNPFFTFINVAGLSVGFAVFFVLWQYSQNELKSHEFHKDHQRIFRLYLDLYHNTGLDWTHYLSGALPPVFASIAKDKFTEIESATRILHQHNFEQVKWAGPQTDSAGWSELDQQAIFSLIDKNGEKHSFLEKNTVYADPNLFEFFSIPLKIGRPEKVLSSADAIVLSSSTVKKYFGDDDPIGKVVTLNDRESFAVAGVFQDLPRNSHLNFELVLSTLRIQHAIENINPFQQSAQSYFKIREGVPVTGLEDKLNQEHELLWDFWKNWWPGSTLTFFLQPLKDVPFRVFDNDVFVPKSKYALQAFQMVSIIILIMAWINYLNLKLSTQSNRMRELATRRTAGAGRSDFAKQFLIESLAINGIAILAAFTLVQLLKGPLEDLFEFYMPRWNEITLSSIMVFGGMITLGILIAGLHPAFSVWRMTTRSMFVQSKLPGSSTNFIHVSSVLQLVSALALIMWLFSVSSQVDFVTSDTWGLDRNSVVVVDMPQMQDKQSSIRINSMKNGLLSIAGVEDVTVSTTVAGDLLENRFGVARTDTTNRGSVPKSDGGVDERFIPFYDLKLLAGRNFLKDNPADRRSVILSRLAARSIGFEAEEAIGKIVSVSKYSYRPFETDAEIIGVIEDHRYEPLYLETGLANANRGTILTYGDYLRATNKALKMSVRINGSDPGNVMNRIEKVFRHLFPENIFHWYFLSDHMNIHYQNEKTARNQITLFTLIGIGIACLGLLGIFSNRVVEKTKEIGIRKVLGARLYQIALILLSTTAKQAIFAIIIGIPVAYYLTQQYLEKFSERITLHWWHYALPVLILVVIMFGSISSVLWNAARSNPVDALKHE